MKNDKKARDRVTQHPMPVLAFASDEVDLAPTLGTVRRRTVIEVSDYARRVVEEAIDAAARCCEPEHVTVLRELATQREGDSELILVVEAIEKHGKVFVRFL